jgi:hypothetical protein
VYGQANVPGAEICGDRKVSGAKLCEDRLHMTGCVINLAAEADAVFFAKCLLERLAVIRVVEKREIFVIVRPTAGRQWESSDAGNVFQTFVINDGDAVAGGNELF